MASRTAPAWVVYQVTVLDYRSDYRGVTDRGYVGQSNRSGGGQQRTATGHRIHADVPFARFLEHLQQRPWSDLIVGVPAVIAGPFATEEAALAAEAAAIVDRLPQYNVDGNPDHPDRVTPWAAAEMRAERDKAREQGRSIHDLGHRRYVTTPRRRPDRGPARTRPVAVDIPAATVGAGQVNGHGHAVPVPGSRTRPAAPRQRRTTPAPATPARRPGPPGSLVLRRVMTALGVAVVLWIAVAIGSGLTGVSVPTVAVVPLVAAVGALCAVWRLPNR